MNFISTFIFLLIQYYVCYVSTTDPCSNYTAINDTTMTVAYKASSNKSLSCQNPPAFKWYRYTGTTTGLMTTACPQDLQCGSLTHIWFNDTLPILSDGETGKQICVHKGPKCCAIRNTIKTKNCSDFIIYRHIPSTEPCTKYCYAGPFIIVLCRHWVVLLATCLYKQAPWDNLTATTNKMYSSTSNPNKSSAVALTVTTNKMDTSISYPDNSSTHKNSQSTAMFPTIWMLVVAVVAAK